MNLLTLHMGRDFDRLPDLVRAAHAGSVRLEGLVTVRRGGHDRPAYLHCLSLSRRGCILPPGCGKRTHPRPHYLEQEL